MKKICVFLFSGTGMTRYVIDKISRELAELEVQVDLFQIEKTDVERIPVSDYAALGIAYPVHAFNAPKIVVRFAKKLPQASGTNVFIISTSGEDHPVNYASSGLLSKILRKKNYRVFFDRQLYMPANFAVKYDEQKVGQMLAAANAQIPQIAQDIANGSSSKQQAGFLTKCLAVIGRAEWFGAVFIGRTFYADKKCSHCGICAASCPNHNITVGQSVRFKWHCGLCMRCLYICPAHAIKVHRPFKFISFDGWYENKELLAERKKQLSD